MINSEKIRFQNGHDVFRIVYVDDNSLLSLFRRYVIFALGSGREHEHVS